MVLRTLLFFLPTYQVFAAGFLAMPKSASQKRRLLTRNVNTDVDVDREVGMDPLAYRQDMIQDLISKADVSDQLYQKGYCIIDNVLPSAEIAQLDLCFSLLDKGGSLQTTPEAALNVRDDAIRFNSEKEAMVPVGKLIKLMKGVADAITPIVSDYYYNTDNDAANDKEETPVAPATRERPLTVTENAMIASYPSGGRYRIHSDNSCGPTGSRLNWREITAITYVNPSWSEDDGGLLRLWPDSQDVSAEQFGWTDQGEKDLRIHLQQTWQERCQTKNAGQEAEYVDVEPIGGRMILFRSNLLHEVRPSSAESRRAVTCWFLRPVTGGGTPCEAYEESQ